MNTFKEEIRMDKYYDKKKKKLLAQNRIGGQKKNIKRLIVLDLKIDIFEMV